MKAPGWHYWNCAAAASESRKSHRGHGRWGEIVDSVIQCQRCDRKTRNYAGWAKREGGSEHLCPNCTTEKDLVLVHGLNDNIDGTCIGCFTPTDTAIGIQGTAEFHAALLSKLFETGPSSSQVTQWKKQTSSS